MPKLELDQLARPAVDQETLAFLRHLTNSGVFKTQYDAWAFGAALALKTGLTPVQAGSGKEQLPNLNTLSEETRFALEQAALTQLGDKAVEDLVEYVNTLAMAGLRHLKSKTAEWTVAESIKWVTNTIVEKDLR